MLKRTVVIVNVFSESDIFLELLGIFKIKREGHFNKTSHVRNYDIISVRLS